MKIEISDEYINWLQKSSMSGEMSESDIAVYINDVLREHRESWEELE